jgi:hypothetical protein
MSDEIERRLRDAIGAATRPPVEDDGSLDAIRSRATSARRRRRVGGVALSAAAALVVGIAIGAAAGRDGAPVQVAAGGDGEGATTTIVCESVTTGPVTTVPATDTTVVASTAVAADAPTTIGLSGDEGATTTTYVRMGGMSAEDGVTWTVIASPDDGINVPETTVPADGDVVEEIIHEAEESGAIPVECLPGGDQTSSTETTAGPSSSAPATGTTMTVPDQAAADEIRSAFVRAFDASTPSEERYALVEDGGAIAAAGDEAAAKFPEASKTITARVHSITLTGPDSADVTFELLYDGAMLLGPQEGEAVRIDGTWKVSRATRCAIIEQAGVSCPAP